MHANVPKGGVTYSATEAQLMNASLDVVLRILRRCNGEGLDGTLKRVIGLDMADSVGKYGVHIEKMKLV